MVISSSDEGFQNNVREVIEGTQCGAISAHPELFPIGQGLEDMGRVA